MPQPSIRKTPRHRNRQNMRLNARHRALSGGDGGVNVRFGVRQRHETGFVLGRGQVDTFFEHGTVPATELFGVALRRVGEVLHRTFGEEETKHARDVTAAHRVAVVLTRLQDALDQALGELVQLFVLTRFAENLQRFDASNHGERVPGERTGLVFLIAFFIKKIKGNEVFWSACISQMLIFMIYIFGDIGYLWLNFIGAFLTIFFSYLLNFLMKKGN